jgi:putative transposase
VVDGLAKAIGLPQVIVLDNRPELTSKAMLCWAEQRKVKLHYIDPGKSTQYAYIESFNGKLYFNGKL